MNIEEINRTLDYYKIQQAILENKIKDLDKEKHKVLRQKMFQLLSKEEKKNFGLLFLYARKIKHLLDQHDELNKKLEKLYYMSFYGLSSKKIITDIKIEGIGRITLGKKGFGYQPYWRYTAFYDFDAQTIIKFFKSNNNLSEFIKNPHKKSLYYIFKKYLRNYITDDNDIYTKLVKLNDNQKFQVLYGDTLYYEPYKLVNGYINQINVYLNTLSIHFISNRWTERRLSLFYFNLNNYDIIDIYFLGKASKILLDVFKKFENEITSIINNNKKIINNLHKVTKKYIGAQLL